MRVVTMVSLGASAVLGVAALVVAQTWLPRATGRAVGKDSAAASKMVPVVIATSAIGYGTKLEAKDLKVAQLPQDAAPAGAYPTVAAALAADAGAPVALVPIAQREAILPAKLSGPGARASVAAMISPGMRGYSIAVTDVSGVGGNALPGDWVDVVLMHDLNKASGGTPNIASDVVIQNVRVLGVDLNADPTSTKTAVPATTTLEVTVGDAQKLAVAAELGTLSLALRRTGSGEVDPVRPVQASDVRGGARPAVLQRPAGQLRVTASPAPAPEGPRRALRNEGHD
jgi:pilus assembly protein CpaB